MREHGWSRASACRSLISTIFNDPLDKERGRNMKPLFDDKPSGVPDAQQRAQASPAPAAPAPAFAPVTAAPVVSAALPATLPAVIPASVPDVAPVVTHAAPLVDASRLISLDEIDQLGIAQGTRIAAFSKQILTSVRASDADQFGDKLNELIATAKGLDPRGADKGGLLTQVTRFFRSTKEKLLAQYESVSSRMDTLVVELENHAQRQKSGIDELERMYNDNYALHQELEQAKRQGTLALEGLRAHLSSYA
ncbi:MAG: TelA-like protein [Burkholderia plantarii]|nr:MAG: TelA-like protein [Burkholderia plantarii]